MPSWSRSRCRSSRATFASRRRTAAPPRSCSAARFARPPSKAACSSGPGPSESTRSSRIPKPTRLSFAKQAFAPASSFRLSLGDVAIGVLAAFDKRTADGRFTGVDSRIAEIFGARAAVAVDLSQRVEQDALGRALDAQEAERRRLALELHDETGQELTSILLSLRQVEEADSDEERSAAIARCARSSFRRCTTCAGSPSSFARRRSTTSVSSRRSSAWPNRSASGRGSVSTSRRPEWRSACRARSRRRFTGSSRRR